MIIIENIKKVNNMKRIKYYLSLDDLDISGKILVGVMVALLIGLVYFFFNV